MTVTFPDKKKILILTADAGFGHRSAANAVRDALKQTYGDKVEAKIVNPMDDERTPAFIRNSQSDYDRILQTLPGLYQLGYRTSDNPIPVALVEGIIALLMFEAMWDLVRTEQPDAILVTYPIYQAPLQQVFRADNRYPPVFTVITDLSSIHQFWFDPAVTGVIVPTEEVRELCLKNGYAARKIHLTGIPVRPAIRNETRTRAQMRRTLGLHPDRTTLLAVGSKRVQHLPEFLNVVDHSGFDLQIVAIAGKNDELFQILQSREWHHPVKLVNYVSDLAPYLRAADLILCKAGGLIVTEALASGLPLILTEVIPGQETGNAGYVVKNKAGLLAESPLQMLEGLQHWLMNDGRGLRQTAENAQRIGRPDSAFLAAELIWKAAQHAPVIRKGRIPVMRARILNTLMEVEHFKPDIQRMMSRLKGK